jgi:hypothetical protein
MKKKTKDKIMKIKLATILLVICFISACGSLNDVTAELHLNKNISTGQELLDLQASLDKGIINQEEFDIEKEKILSGSEIFEIEIEEFENFDSEGGKVKIKINVNGSDIKVGGDK